MRIKRNILLVEPNYKNKFPPIGLMKLSTYFKSLGDNVFFFKGDIKDFILERAVEKCIGKLISIAPGDNWRSKHDAIKSYIKTRKAVYLERLEIANEREDYVLILDWLNYFKDYIWKKYYLNNDEKEWDWIGVTTLFTFYFDITVKTINQVKELLKPNGQIMVGGVLATLQPEELEAATNIKPFVGLLNKPGIIDNGNEIIIDTLPLDYSILEETDYRYDMSNAYYGSMTKGCVRHCAFCAVPKIEPEYKDYIPMSDRIERVKNKFGEQKDLLLMDNNVLASERFNDIIDDIIKCGFQRGATYQAPNQLKLAISNLQKGINDRAYLRMAHREYSNFLSSIKEKELSYKVYSILYDFGLLSLGTSTKDNAIKAYELISNDYAKFYKRLRPRQRIVDFNQGVDARLFTEEKAEMLSKIAISPLRIAFDSLSVKDDYIQAVRWSAKYGIKNFSNYLLYNFTDKPSDLYERLKINVELCDELGINVYSFPMKYHPLLGEYSHDRDYIGKHWNRKYIRSIQAILNSTKGSIGRGRSYFHKAFGRDIHEYYTLLEMPDTYIIYRFFFEWLEKKSHPLSMKRWVDTMNSLSIQERDTLLSIIHDRNFTQTNMGEDYGERINEVLKFYVNLRDEISDPKGCLWKLKQEFDSLPKDELNYIKDSFAGVLTIYR